MASIAMLYKSPEGQWKHYPETDLLKVGHVQRPQQLRQFLMFLHQVDHDTPTLYVLPLKSMY